jgi:uracil-DNA glycosylase family 4
VTGAERRAALEAIADEVRACTLCRLHTGRTRAVPGEGSPETEVAFVGEGPGFNEDQQGRPFVGAAGGLLTELLALVGWQREDVFITNVVKCRPPGNRDPEADEIAACAPYLRRQLAALDPAVVVTLGRFSLGTFQPGARISSVHGTARPIDTATGAVNAVTYAMYHPAAAFRQAALKETLFNDMANLPQVLVDARARRATAGDAGSTSEAGVGAAEGRPATMGEPSARGAPDGAHESGTGPGLVSATATPGEERPTVLAAPVATGIVRAVHVAPPPVERTAATGVPEETSASRTEVPTDQMTLFQA